jgi:multiple sugar transport system permease protein
LATTTAAGLAGRTSPSRAERAAGWASRGLTGVLVVLGLMVASGPFLLALWTSLKPPTDVLQGRYLTLAWSLESYSDAWTLVGMARYLRTTAIYASGSALATVLASALAGYAFARLRFPGRDVLFALMLATIMIPGSVTIVPLVVVMLRFPLIGGNDLFGQGGTGLYNTMVGLILPSLASPTSVFLLRQFFRMLPSELEDAARIDGAGELQIWWRIMLPLSGPGLATVALFSFQNHWNSYLWPLVMSRSEELYTITIGMAALHATAAGLRQVAVHPSVLAGSIMTVVPVLVVFLVGQRYFRQGIALTGFR